MPFHGADMEKKFEIVKYIDPRFDCNNPAYIDTRYVVVSGGPQISRYQTKCDEFSNDMYRWGNRRTLGSKFLYDSHWYIKYTVIVKINFRSPWNIIGGQPIMTRKSVSSPEKPWLLVWSTGTLKPFTMGAQPAPVNDSTLRASCSTQPTPSQTPSETAPTA